MTEPTHYEVLGVDPGADRETIRQAYVAIARATHPDRASGDPAARAEASRAIRAANTAWNVLGDASRRSEYDRRLHDRRVPTRPVTTSAARTRIVPGRAVPPEPAPARASGWAWVAVALLVMGVIGVLVVSAYATSSDTGNGATGSTTSTRAVFAVGQCVQVTFPSGRRDATVVPCTGVVTGRILTVVDTPRPCPAGTAVELSDSKTTLCLEPA